MNDHWFQDYILLAFRIDKAIQAFSKNSPFIDYYYGPSDWKARAQAEPATPPADLLRAANNLADALPLQHFEPHRTAYLAKQVLAMETVCRKLCGEAFSLEDEVQRCFDVRRTWTPEEQFEQAWALYDRLLPGEGSLSERLSAMRSHYLLTPEKLGLLVGFMQQALAEARHRTQAFVNLPAGEEVEVQTVNDQVWGAYNHYLGNYRSRIELNIDLPTDLRSLLNAMCHEGYPGHHTELTLKEQLLYRARGYLEQSIGLLISPQAVISEGIATLATDMIFSANEQRAWLAEHIYPEAGIEPLAINWEQLPEIGKLWLEVRGNAVFLLFEGLSDKEVIQYLSRYLMLSDDRAAKELAYLKRPFRESYIFTYSSGKRLMQPWLQGSDRLSVFRRFLTEQIYPSELVKDEQGIIPSSL